MEIPVVAAQSSVLSESFLFISLGLGALTAIVFLFMLFYKGLTKLTLVTFFITFCCASYTFLVSQTSYAADTTKLEKEIIETYKVAKAEPIQPANWKTVLPPNSVALYQITTSDNKIGNCFVVLESDDKLNDNNNTGKLECGTMIVEPRDNKSTVNVATKK